MAAPEDATVELFYRARCRCGWQGKECRDSAEAHTDRRLHLLTHVTHEVRKGGGKR